LLLFLTPDLRPFEINFAAAASYPSRRPPSPPLVEAHRGPGFEPAHDKDLPVIKVCLVFAGREPNDRCTPFFSTISFSDISDINQQNRLRINVFYWSRF
jgi:hypothetical protein